MSISNAATAGIGVSLTPSTNVQLGSTTRYDVSTNLVGKEYVAPFVVAMLADASGKIQVLEQNTVQITGIDAVFDITASTAQAKALIGAFKVEEVNGVPTTSWYAGQDISANIAVTMQNQTAFIAALADLIRDEAGQSLTVSESPADASNNDSIRLYLRDEAHQDIIDILNYTGLANLLEASDLQSFEIDLDASGGATNMYTALDGAAALLRRVMFTQLPLANVHAYSQPSDGSNTASENVSIMNFLPFLKGDKLSFVFDCRVGQRVEGASAITSGAVITTSETGATTSATTASAPNSITDPAGGIIIGSAASNSYASPTLTLTTPSVRRVALRIQLDSGSGAFANTISSGVQSLNA